MHAFMCQPMTTCWGKFKYAIALLFDPAWVPKMKGDCVSSFAALHNLSAPPHLLYYMLQEGKRLTALVLQQWFVNFPLPEMMTVVTTDDR